MDINWLDIARWVSIVALITSGIMSIRTGVRLRKSVKNYEAMVDLYRIQLDHFTQAVMANTELKEEEEAPAL